MPGNSVGWWKGDKLLLNGSGDPGIQSVIYSNQNNLNARLFSYVNMFHNVMLGMI